MPGEARGEFAPAARILVLQLHPARAEGIAPARGFHPLAFDQDDGPCRLVAELLALAWLGAIAAAGDDQGQSTVGIGEAEMQRGEPAHRDADDMRLVDRQGIERGANVVPGAGLRISRGIFGYIGGRVAAGIVGDGAIAPSKMAQLALVAAVIVGEFMNEDDRGAGTGLLVIKPDAVVGREVWHRRPFFGTERAILGTPARLWQAAGWHDP